ncbi:hypothetical protein SDC9_102135 [bioreactor metagenome]|uniref:Uncharacterized protein n=1 Tax=bioreactor metagenome TaxID=1076179 RepID=A0A645ASP9_9ZZZZ
MQLTDPSKSVSVKVSSTISLPGISRRSAWTTLPATVTRPDSSVSPLMATGASAMTAPLMRRSLGFFTALDCACSAFLSSSACLRVFSSSSASRSRRSRSSRLSASARRRREIDGSIRKISLTAVDSSFVTSCFLK